MRVHEPLGDERRSAGRVGILADKPVYIATVLDGKELGLLVENFGMGGALLICPQGSDALRPGKRLPECHLVLPDVGRVPVDAIIRWRVWPRAGIQFDRMSGDARDLISRFLQALEVTPQSSRQS